MIKGNEHILIEYETWDADINELKLMTFGDNLSKVWHTNRSERDDDVCIVLTYDNIDAHKFRGIRVAEGWLITEDKRISLQGWEDDGLSCYNK